MSMQVPTRTATTEKRYIERFGQLWRRASKELKRSFGVIDLVHRFLVWSKNLRPNSLRQYRAALEFGLERLAQQPHLRAEVAAALTLLDSTRQQDSATPKVRKPKADMPLRTSASKAKAISDRDFDRIVAAAPLFRSQYIDDLVASMNANILPGLRPIEWHGTSITISGDTLIMIVPNGKNTNNRAHGETRTLIFEAIDPVSREHLVVWNERVNGMTLEEYETLLTRIEERMRVISRRLFPRRKWRPTAYSIRHAVSARLKRFYIGNAETHEERDHGAAIVAALMGHAADDTASRHYGNASGKGGRGYPIPKADPVEAARIRPKVAESRRKMNAMLDSRRSIALR